MAGRDPRRGLRLALTVVSLVAATGVLAACVADWLNRSAGFDARPLTVATIPLFNQRQLPRLAKRSWRGDWILRRERLELVDQGLRNAKPDVLILQELMARINGGAETDRAILSAGSLLDYEWRQQEVQTFEDTLEVESLGVAAAPPTRLSSSRTKPRLWALGQSGALWTTALDYEGQVVTIFNVKMPAPSEPQAPWYPFIRDRIADTLRQDHTCSRRLIVAGYMPADESVAAFANLLGSHKLKDVSAGFCQAAATCFTATSANDLFMAVQGDDSPGRTDKILIHQSGYVYSSARLFGEAETSHRYAREYGMAKMWATMRFGWLAQVRLGRCSAGELEPAN